MSVEIRINGNPKEGNENGVSAGILTTAINISNEAKGLAPVDKGELRSSIDYGLLDPDTGIVGTNVEYSTYVEFGTRKMVAQPFLRPAATIAGGGATAAQVKRDLNDQMRRELKKGTRATRIK